MTDSTEAEQNPFQQSRLLNAERLQLINRTVETLANGIDEELSRWLSDVTVTPGEVEQSRMIDLADGTRDLAIVKAKWAMTNGVITTDLTLALSVIAMLCGGIPNPPPEVRPLSRLEVGVYDLILEPLLRLVVELFDIGDSELGPHAASPSALPDSQTEASVFIGVDVKVGSLAGQMGVCLSGTQLQNYLEELDRRIAGRMAGSGDGPNELVVRAVQPIEVEFVAGFEPLQVPAKQLVGLQVGDVLRTRQSISRPLIARVGGEHLYHIKAAQQGERLVAQLIGHAEPTSDSARGRPTGGTAPIGNAAPTSDSTPIDNAAKSKNLNSAVSSMGGS